MYQQNNIYYVDALDGSDLNPGTGPERPWKFLDRVNCTTFFPGDRILFKADGIWYGCLKPKGSGMPGKPIVIDMYGSGNKPVINREGVVSPGKVYQKIANGVHLGAAYTFSAWGRVDADGGFVQCCHQPGI